MQRPRLYDFRISGGPEAIGLCNTDTLSISAAVNEAQERLMNDPLAPDEGFWGSWVRMAFNLTQANPYFITPREVARVILLDVCKHPVRIHNGFFEFMEFGRGFQPGGCCNRPGAGCQSLAAYERETVVTAFPLAATPQTIRVYPADPRDKGLVVLPQGKDANAKDVLFIDPVSAQSGRGESIVLDVPFADSANLFSSLDGFQKNKTFGEVQIFQVDPATGAESPLVVMQPGEMVAQYRKYFVNGLPTHCCNTPGGVIQVMAQCKLDFIPAASDVDYLMIQSVPALIDECMAVRLGRMESTAAQTLSGTKHASALRLLFGQLDNVLGKERPAITRSIFGSQPLRRQPV
jgi:hypothetical protein